MTIDITPEAVEHLCAIHEGYEQHGTVVTLRALSAALERSQSDCLEAFRRRDVWKSKAEGFDVVRLALREKVGSPWPPSLSRAIWAGIAADEKARADTAEAALTASQAETAAAYEAAAAMIETHVVETQFDGSRVVVPNPLAKEDQHHRSLAKAIRALTPADSNAALNRMIADARADGMRKAAGIVNQHSEIGRTSLAKTEDVGHRMMWTAIIQRSDFIRERILAAIPKGTNK